MQLLVLSLIFSSDDRGEVNHGEENRDGNKISKNASKHYKWCFFPLVQLFPNKEYRIHMPYGMKSKVLEQLSFIFKISVFILKIECTERKKNQVKEILPSQMLVQFPIVYKNRSGPSRSQQQTSSRSSAWVTWDQLLEP